MDPAEERELVERARADDRDAREAIARKLYPALLASALRMARRRDVAEDLAQEAVFRALRAIRTFDGRSTLFTWAYRILVNLWLNFARQEGRQRSGTLSFDEMFADGKQTADKALGPEHLAADREHLRKLWEAICGLPESLRVTLLLVVFEELNYEEIGHALGCSEGTVAWRVFRAREILRENLRDVLVDAPEEA
ncbi:MAG: sigma-70 family RNA polymerase sigma factor [Deltaproteobacteria bacterium]|nr:sigma-70 family RNA polymerase sigma factor [Deltaproteobacteria bacterium]